jgi:hypothetical protein
MVPVNFGISRIFAKTPQEANFDPRRQQSQIESCPLAIMATKILTQSRKGAGKPFLALFCGKACA